MRSKSTVAILCLTISLLLSPAAYGRGFGGGGGGGGRGGGGLGGGGGIGGGGGGMRAGGGGGGFGGGGEGMRGGGGFGGGGAGGGFGGGAGGGMRGGPGGGGFGGEGMRGGGGGGGFGGGGLNDRGGGGPGGGGFENRGVGGAGQAGGGFGGGAGGFGERGLGGAGQGGFGGAGAGGPGGRGFGEGAAGAGGFGNRGLGEGAGGFGDRGYGAAGAGRLPTDFGLSHYSGFAAGGAVHQTQMWSNNYLSAHGNAVRANFNNFNYFQPNWNVAHPGAWAAAGWTAGMAWNAASWGSLSQWCSIPAAPVYYDYGNTVVYQGGDVYVNGDDAGSADAYSQQASTLASQGSEAQPTPQDQWQPLGVFALTQGDDKSTNNLFQLAISQSNIIRGNYYDAVTDETTPVNGSVDPKTQRAAWTIGNKQDRVFDTGVYNLTKDQTPVLVHIGKDSTQQMLLVRMPQPNGQQGSQGR